MTLFPAIDAAIAGSFQLAWEDDERAFYRGWRNAAGDHQSVLAVVSLAERRALGDADGLVREYELREELDEAWAARPLELLRQGGRNILILDDHGVEPLGRLVGSPMELRLFLRIAVGLSSAIGKMHDRRIIHKNIKPTNVLVNRSTGEVWLIGFGIASRQLRERQMPDHPERVAGTLAYMAPEQTGRMNCSIDSRSDLYAFGVTLYQMLTGSLPFTTSDPMELVHCHIARKPVPPSERVENIPTPLSQIIEKLLAKTSEERYQTAAGVESDLRHCLAEWELQRRIDGFLLAEHDITDRLLIPEKLYGRAREVETLLAAFDRVIKSGAPELVLVSGYSGIGKSSVVNELHPVLVPHRGLFASGKFDQYKRDIPYATLVQAFESLVRSLLSRGEAELASWRHAFSDALGPNGQLVVNLVPELQLIIGEQPPVPELPPQQAQNRFHLVFRRFISVFAQSEHPLALFLDDLQWLDAATLDLVEDLLTRSDLQHLMLIGAYRNNEIDAAHPLRRKLEVMKNGGANIEQITLGPLASEHIAQLIADALRCSSEQAAPVARLIHDKTAGNPFFVIQFLHALVDEGLLWIDHAAGGWSWDLGAIDAKGYTDNVVDLMVGKVARLPNSTQTALGQLACLGNMADVNKLSLILGIPEEQVHATLREAARLEMVERLPRSYRFVHDRVQEVAYSIIPLEVRAEAHLRIGRLLAAHTRPEELEEAIFEIVNHQNHGVALLTATDEREQLADLNLVAGKRAKASTAYASALVYFSAGAALLAEDCWARRYQLSFALEFHRAECELLTGELEAAEQRLGSLGERAANVVDRAAVTCLLIDLYTTLNQNDRAIMVGLQYLRGQDIEWSPHPTEEDGRREYERVWSQLGSRTIDELVELPLMNDSTSLATMDVLNGIATPALGTDSNLPVLVASRAVNLSLERGNCHGSSLAYERLAVVAGVRFADYKAASSLGRLGCELVERRGLTRFEAGTYLLFESRVLPWTRHVRSGRELVRRGFDAANRGGDLIYAVYGCANLIRNMLAAGDHLSETQSEAERGFEFARKIRFAFFVDLITVQLQLVRALRGLTRSIGCWDDGQFDERQFEGHLSNGPSLVRPECHYWIRKLQAHFLAGNLAAANDAASNAQPLLSLAISPLEMADYHFYAALSRAALHHVTDQERQQHAEAIAAHHAQLQIWRESCPENFGNLAALVGAEIARLDCRQLDAEQLYEEAIQTARVNGFVHNEALAYELAAKFYADRGFVEISITYLRSARSCYRRWGALGKVRQLDLLHPQLRQEDASLGPTSTIAAPVDQLDFATVLKVSQAVSDEVILDRVIDSLMRAAIEHAGAERGLLILFRGVEHIIEAKATTSGESVIVCLQDMKAAQTEMPESVVRYVARTRELVILDDALSHDQFLLDPYILNHHVRSILCLPLLNQSKLTGALYLENRLTPHVFTPERLAILRLLASQAAISLENAWLYREARESDRRNSEMHAQLAHMNRVATVGQMAASIAHEVNQPIAAAAINASAAVRWLAREQPDLEQALQSLNQITKSTERASEIVAGIRAIFAKAPQQKEPFEVNDAIREVIVLAQGEARKNGIAIVTALEEGLPRPKGDRVQLQQVMLNLINNAMQAMHAAGVESPELMISSGKSDSDGVVIAVRDSGPGLDPADPERVFEAFYTTKPGGLGMGLSICRSIIESHGGRLWASANMPRGAAFQFTIPVQVVADKGG